MMASGIGDKNQLKLYSCYMSSCSYRVRIALNLKGLKYEYKAVNLLKGEQFSPAFNLSSNYSCCNMYCAQYLEEKYPQYLLLPQDLHKRGINYQAANIVSSSIQPFQNIDTLKYIEEKVGPGENLFWAKHHITKGFAALEKLLKGHAGRYATGDEVFLADLFLAPQMHGAIKRFNFDMTQFPLLSRLNDEYNKIPAFQDAMPENQPDTPAASSVD